MLVTFGNAGVKDPLLNFVSYANSAGAAHVVGSVDVTMFDLLAARGTRCTRRRWRTRRTRSTARTSTRRARGRSLRGCAPARSRRSSGLAYTVLHTDCDIVYLRDPAPYLMCTPAAEGGRGGARRRGGRATASSPPTSPSRRTTCRPAATPRATPAIRPAAPSTPASSSSARPPPAASLLATDWHRLVVDPPRGSQFAPLTSDQQVFNHMMRASASGRGSRRRMARTR